MPHTKKWYRLEHSYPVIADRDTYDAWVALGKKPIAERASEHVIKILRSNPPALVEKDVRNELTRILTAYAKGMTGVRVPVDVGKKARGDPNPDSVSLPEDMARRHGVDHESVNRAGVKERRVRLGIPVARPDDSREGRGDVQGIARRIDVGYLDDKVRVLSRGGSPDLRLDVSRHFCVLRKQF